MNLADLVKLVEDARANADSQEKNYRDVEIKIIDAQGWSHQVEYWSASYWTHGGPGLKMAHERDA